MIIHFNDSQVVFTFRFSGGARKFTVRFLVCVGSSWFLLTEDMVLKKRKEFHFSPKKIVMEHKRI
jgi:hypothetical protein